MLYVGTRVEAAPDRRQIFSCLYFAQGTVLPIHMGP